MGKVKLPKIKSSHPVNPVEFNAFLKLLPPQIKVLVETYKFASKVYATVGLLYYWQEIFSLPAYAIYKLERGPWQINLFRNSRYGSQGEQSFSHYLPDNLLKKLMPLYETRKEGYLFQQEDGRPFDFHSLNNEFRKASRRAVKQGVIKKRITPLHIRVSPPLDIKFLPGSLSSNLLQSRLETLRDISEDEVHEVVKLLPPSPRNSGCPRKHPIRDILQVLLLQEDFRLSRKELVKCFPRIARAAETQRRSWKKKGVWLKILAIFKS